MSFSAITQHMAEIEDRNICSGIVLGVNVNSGCNMLDVAGRYCSYCAITQCNERGNEEVLSREQFTQAIYGATKVTGYSLEGVTVCGDEPTISDEVFYERTVPVLTAAKHVGTRYGLITNGFNLLKYQDDLLKLEADISVSLDAVGENNDRFRGGYYQVLNNLTCASAALKEKITIASVMKPGREEELEPLLDVIVELGIKKWVLSCLVRFRDATFAAVSRDTFCFLDMLAKKARKYGIELLFDYHGKDAVSTDFLRTVRKPRSIHLVRLCYDSEISVESHIFNESQRACKWITDNCISIIIDRLIYQELYSRNLGFAGGCYFAVSSPLAEARK